MHGQNAAMHLVAGVTALVAGSAAPVSAKVTFQWTTVGDVGNAPDPLTGITTFPPLRQGHGLGTMGYALLI